MDRLELDHSVIAFCKTQNKHYYQRLISINRKILKLENEKAEIHRGMTRNRKTIKKLGGV